MKPSILEALGRPMTKSQNHAPKGSHDAKGESNGGQFISTGKAVRKFVADTQAGKRAGLKVTFNITNQAKAQDLARVLHGPIPVGAPEFTLSSTALHVQRRHPNVTLDDWENLPDLANSYDQALLLSPRRGDPGPRVMFVKRLSNREAYAYIAELHTSTRQGGAAFNVVTFFKDHINAVASHLKENAHNQTAVGEFEGRNQLS